MTPSSDLCGGCSKPFYGRQKCISCEGNCGKRFHHSCTQLLDAQLRHFLKLAGSGQGYICSACDGSAEISVPYVELPLYEIQDSDQDRQGLVCLSKGSSSAKQKLGVDAGTFLCSQEGDLSDVVKLLLEKISGMENKIDRLVTEVSEMKVSNFELASQVLLLSKDPNEHPLSSNVSATTKPSFSQVIKNTTSTTSPPVSASMMSAYHLNLSVDQVL